MNGDPDPNPAILLKSRICSRVLIELQNLQALGDQGFLFLPTGILRFSHLVLTFQELGQTESGSETQYPYITSYISD
jgi:hypothetical protein